MLYTEGTISVTNGSQVVTGTGTAWGGTVSPGNLFYVTSGVHYVVAAIVSDTELYLSSPYGQASDAVALYTIYSDFTEFYNLPYPSTSDVEKATILERSITEVDISLDTLGTRVAALETPVLLITASGAVQAETATGSGVGFSFGAATIHASGDVQAETATATGAALVESPGVVTGTGAPQAETATATGSGNVVSDPNIITASGSAQAETATGTGEGTVSATALVTADADDVTADSSTVTADGSTGGVPFEHVTGTGAPQAETATGTGSGEINISGLLFDNPVMASGLLLASPQIVVTSLPDYTPVLTGVEVASKTSLNVYWDENGADSYKIYYDTDTTSDSIEVIHTAYLLENLTEDETYTISVTAFTSTGESAHSNEMEGTPTEYEIPVLDKVDSAGPNELNVIFTETDAASYNVYKYLADEENTAGSPHLLESLTTDDDYSVTVTALYNEPSLAPTLSNVEILGATSLRVYFVENGADSYNVYYDDGNSIESDNVSGSYHDLISLTTGTPYEVTVTGVLNGVESIPSNAVTKTPAVLGSFVPNVHRTFEGTNGASATQGGNGFDTGVANPNVDPVFSTDVAYSGATSAKVTVEEFPANNEDIKYFSWGGVIDSVDGIAQLGDEFWVRYAIWYPNDFLWDHGSITFMNDIQGGTIGVRCMMRDDTWEANNDLGAWQSNMEHGGLSATQEGTRAICGVAQEDIRSEFYAKNQIDEYPWSTTIKFGPNIPSGQWVFQEMYVLLRNDNTGVLRHYLDGDLIFEDTDIKTCTREGHISKAVLFEYWDNGAPQTQHCYVGDFVFTTSTPPNKGDDDRPIIGTWS